MRLRTFLLFGTALPLALGTPTFAAERNPSNSRMLLQLAANAACPEGQECPPAQGGAEPQQEGAQPDATGETPQQQGQPPQEGAQPGAAEGTQQQQGEPQQEGAQPDATGETPQQQQQQEQQQQGQPAQEGAQPGAAEGTQEQQGQPQEEGGQQGGADQGQQQEQQQQPADESSTNQTEAPLPVEDSTVEQQLDAQGDQGEANNVRSLRQRLQKQLEGAGIFPEEGGQNLDGQGNQGNDNRNRDRRRGDGNAGWWNRDEDRDVVERRGGRIIIDLGGILSVEPVAPDEGGRLLYGADDVEVQNLPHGQTRTIVHRRNGVEIVTVRDRYGDIVKRSKILPNGTEIVLIDNRFPDDYQGGRQPRLYDVPPPVVGIPQNQYIIDYGDASETDILGALRAPPVQQIGRPYTLGEVLDNEQIRAYSPRIDLDSITFETGSATIGSDQMRSLLDLGQAMQQVIAESPDELYLIEGHTDAVGSPKDNLILSDQRAEAVATALSQNFEIPPENLVTQGYGEEFLKINTGGPEQRNRRATIRRLTELLQAQNQ